NGLFSDVPGGGWRYKGDSQSSAGTAGGYHETIPEVDSDSSSENNAAETKSPLNKLVRLILPKSAIFSQKLGQEIEISADSELECVHEEAEEEELEEEEKQIYEELYYEEEVTPTDRGMECLKSIRIVYAALWWFLQPLLFVLIGTEVNLFKLFTERQSVGHGIFALLIALIFRICFSVLAVTPSKLLLKERIFVAIAWLPKATVQAAIGSEALDRARALPDQDNVETQVIVDYGKTILSLAVLSILITAPLGAMLIPLTAPRLLKHTPRTFNVSGETGNEAHSNKPKS
ncbi:Sodium/hydrogen exchanger 9B2, partial [Cichlidogyrus casuarinus]